MLQHFDIWLFLAGLGVFLFGLNFIENALNNLAGRPFKKFLRQQTTNPLKGILAGILVTAVLQSSSVVSLMVMAFVGAGILALRNAIGIIFGTNLGTTFTGWIVAYLGFQFDIEGFALPMIAIGGLFLIFFNQKEKAQETGRFLFGFGFLFVGLSWMKESIDYLATNFDLSYFQDFGPYWFFIIGLILTAIIQSSSAAMVITLSALNANIISIEAGAAMVIGNDLGTTITVLLGALKGTSAKRRVAFSHFFFNLICDILALGALFPLLWFITDILNFSNPLIILVCFHSSFNLLGIILWLPFIGAFARFLEKRFVSDTGTTEFITKVTPEVPEAAIEALSKETERFIKMTMELNIEGFRINKGLFEYGRLFHTVGYSRKYAELKQLEGELIAYYIGVQNQKMEDDESDRLNQLIASLRNAMQSGKNIKDITHNIKEFETSSNDIKLSLYALLKGQLNELYLSLYHLLKDEYHSVRFESLVSLREKNHMIYQNILNETYSRINSKQLSEMEISTLLNVNREVYNANRALILAIKDLVLSSDEAKDFGKLPESFSTP